MKRKKIIKIALLVIGLLVVIGGSIVYYMFNMPHRDVQASGTDFTLSSTQIVGEYLSNPEKANEKYLDKEGESKIIEISGIINKISEDFNGNKVVLLKSQSDSAGVSCTFSRETNANASNLKIGDEIIIKGVIRSGASFDPDLDMYEDVIMEKCDLVTNK